MKTNTQEPRLSAMLAIQERNAMALAAEAQHTFNRVSDAVELLKKQAYKDFESRRQVETRAYVIAEKHVITGAYTGENLLMKSFPRELLCDFIERLKRLVYYTEGLGSVLLYQAEVVPSGKSDARPEPHVCLTEYDESGLVLRAWLAPIVRGRMKPFHEFFLSDKWN